MIWDPGSQSQKEMAAKKKWQRIFFCHPHTGKIQGKHKNRNSLFATELYIALTIQQTQLVFSGHCAFSSQDENILNEYQMNRTLNISKFAFYPEKKTIFGPFWPFFGFFWPNFGDKRQIQRYLMCDSFDTHLICFQPKS